MNSKTAPPLPGRVDWNNSTTGIISNRAQLTLDKKLENILLLNAEERYVELLNSNGQILNKIPQYEIASYLNVSPETVSRIRKKLSMLS